MRTARTSAAERKTRLSDIDAIDAAAAAFPGNWSVDVLPDDGAELRALLMPEAGDRFAASFLLEEVTCGWQLTSHRWDRFEAKAVFADLVGVVEHLTQVATAATQAGGSAVLN